MKNKTISRFEVSLQERNAQRFHSKNYHRLTKQGYSLCRITEHKKEKLFDSNYKLKFRSRNGKYMYSYAYLYILDEFTKRDSVTKLAWLTAKQATFLRMKGFHVEDASPNERSNKVGL